MAQIISTFVRLKLFTEKISFHFTRFASYKVLLMCSLLWCVISRCIVMTTRNSRSLLLRSLLTRINLPLVRDYFSILFLRIANISRVDTTNANAVGKMMLYNRFRVQCVCSKYDIKYWYRPWMRIHESLFILKCRDDGNARMYFRINSHLKCLWDISFCLFILYVRPRTFFIG